MNFKINSYFNQLYNKALSNAQKSIARKVLFFFSFVESIIFPIPVDPLLAFLVLADKKKFIHLTILCTLGSLAGGLIGWLIGYIIGPSVQEFFIKIPSITDQTFNKVLDAHNNYGSLIVFLGAFTPLPFKIISITSGIFKINLFSFLIMSFIGRGLRFFLVSALVNYFGDKAIEVLRKRFFLITCLIGIFICFIIYLQSMNKL